MHSGSCAVWPQGAEMPNAMALMFTYFRGVTGGRPTHETLREGIKLPAFTSHAISPQCLNVETPNFAHTYLNTQRKLRTSLMLIHFQMMSQWRQKSNHRLRSSHRKSDVTLWRHCDVTYLSTDQKRRKCIKMCQEVSKCSITHTSSRFMLWRQRTRDFVKQCNLVTSPWRQLWTYIHQTLLKYGLDIHLRLCKSWNW